MSALLTDAERDELKALREEVAGRRYEDQNADLQRKIALHATRAWKEQAVVNESRAALDEAAARLEEESNKFVVAREETEEFTPLQCFLAGALLGVAAFSFGLTCAGIGLGVPREGDPRNAH